jgi:hypothetical protein
LSVNLFPRFGFKPKILTRTLDGDDGRHKVILAPLWRHCKCYFRFFFYPVGDSLDPKCSALRGRKLRFGKGLGTWPVGRHVETLGVSPFGLIHDEE